VLLLLAAEAMARSGGRAIAALALIGHETLLVYVLHLQLLYGGVLWPAPLAPWTGQLGLVGAGFVLALMVPALLGAAWTWHRAKMRWPRAAQVMLLFLTVAFIWEFFTRPW
jgi:hypothetical protein